jgi:hypothetical protein
MALVQTLGFSLFVLASTTFDAVSDRIGMAASTLDRFGL